LATTKALIFAFALPLLLATCGTNNAAVSTTELPDWISDPHTRFDRQTYIAARGSGSSLAVAESNALGNLAAFFEQHIELNETAIERYQQAVRDGVTVSWSVDTEVDSMILRHARFDSLIGAEIGGVWNDGRSYFAVAILDKVRAIGVYSEIARSNQRTINTLLDMPHTTRNSLEGLSRYQFAATIADMTVPYLNLLSLLGAPPVQGFMSGNDLRLAALGIIRAIPVYLRVENDRAARIEGAFSRALWELGFQSGGNNSRYALEVNVYSTPVEITGSPFNWTRIDVSANLVDAALGTVLLPYNFTLREGHTSQEEADNRAIMMAERRINEEYARLLSDYLARLLPSDR